MILEPERIIFERTIGFELVMIMVEIAVMFVRQRFAHRMIGEPVTLLLSLVGGLGHDSFGFKSRPSIEQTALCLPRSQGKASIMQRKQLPLPRMA
jgi:hypothetical protein